jgi:hypothetical protein
VLADRNDDLAAAIDDDRDTGAIKPWTDGDLHDWDSQQNNEIDDHGSHMIPSTVDVAVEVTTERSRKFHLKRTLQKCIPPENPAQTGFSGGVPLTARQRQRIWPIAALHQSERALRWSSALRLLRLHASAPAG